MSISRYIPSFASSLKKRRMEIEKNSVKLAKEKNDEALNNRQKVKEILYKEMVPVANSMMPHPEWVQAGDLAILDIYLMRGTMYRHGWDGGPGAVQSCVKKEDVINPIWCKILNVGVDYSLNYELIDRYLDSVDVRELEHAAEQRTAINLFRTWVNLNFRRPKNDPDLKNLGLYFSCAFDPNMDFKPSWRLSAEYFLKKGTEMAMATEEVWNEEIEIELERESLKLRASELEKRKTDLRKKLK